MSECKHLSVVRWYFDDTGECCDLWGCTECRQRFEPLTAKDEMTQRTHWDGCWKSGPKHYECALVKIVRLTDGLHESWADIQTERRLSFRNQVAALEAEVERLRSNLAALEDEKNTYIDCVGNALGQGEDESLWDAAQRVLSGRDGLWVECDELSEQLTEAWIERDALQADAERYRWIRDNAKEELLYPARAGGEVPDLRTKWSIPTLICGNCIGGYMSFDESIDSARGES